MKGTERWLHVRGTVAELGAFHPTSRTDDRPRRVRAGAYRLGAPVVPMYVDHVDERRHVGWIVRLSEDRGHVWVEGLVTSEWRGLDVVSGYRRALSVGVSDQHAPAFDVERAQVDEVSLVRSGCDPTARIRDWWWIDHADGERIGRRQVEIVEEVRRAMQSMQTMEVAA